MNILVLNYEYPPIGGGAALVCRDISVEMAHIGHNVTVVTMGFQGLPQHEVKDGVEIHRVKCLRRRQHVCMPWEAYTYIVSSKQFLGQYLHTHHFDVCHAHFVIPTGPVAKWAKMCFGIPFVITAHGSDVEGHNEKATMKIMHRLLRPAWRRIVKETYAVAAPSECLLKLMNRKVADDRYVLIPNGLDISKYQTDRSQKEKRILLMGRMQVSKNYQTALKAIAMIPNEVWDGWTVDVLGDGPYRGELEKLSIDLGIESRVKFYGWVNNGSLKQLDVLKRASIYISASHFENCPMSVLEAIAAGCYPLLSDIEGHRQFLENSQNKDNYLFPSDDASVLARKLMSIMGDVMLGGYCKEKTIDIHMYELRNIVERYISILESAAVSGEIERHIKD